MISWLRSFQDLEALVVQQEPRKLRQLNKERRGHPPSPSDLEIEGAFVKLALSPQELVVLGIGWYVSSSVWRVLC